MKKIKFISILLITIIALLFMGCGEDPGAAASRYDNSNLPDNYSIRLPASVSGSSSKSATKSTGYVSYLEKRKLRLNKLLANLKSARNKTVSRGTGVSSAYSQLMDQIGFLKDFTKEFAIQFMAVDSAYNDILSYISTNGSNTVPASNVSFTFTEPMANNYLATMGDFLTTDDVNYVNQAIGLPGYFPEVVYETNVDSIYDYKITLNGAFIVDPFLLNNPEPFNYSTNNMIVIKWNDAKTKVYVLRTMTDEDFMTSELSVYDSLNNIATLRFNSKSDGMTNKLNMKFEGGKDNNGIILDINESMSDLDGVFQYTLTGIADDLGGFLEETISDSIGTIYFRETFNATGTLTGMASSSNGTDWDTDPTFGDLDTDYSSAGTNSSMLGVINVAFTAIVTNTNCFISIAPTNTSASEVMFNSIGTAMIGFSTNDSMNWIDFWGDVSQVSNAILFIEQEIDVNGMIMITNIPIDGGLYILP